MSLDFMRTPEYELTLSNNRRVKYRPFLIKEEKNLLMANESNDEAEITNAFINVVQDCTLTDIDVTKLPVYDFEYLWLHIRGKSVGENIDLKLKCPDDDSVTVDYQLNLDDVKPDLNKKVETKVEFEPGYGVIMKMPTIKELTNKKSIIDLSFELVRDCIAQIYNNEEVYEAKDLTIEERTQFVEHLTATQFSKIRKFFDSLPVISHLIKYENPKTGVKHELILQGSSDFFR